jgi:hypothetical protein
VPPHLAQVHRNAIGVVRLAILPAHARKAPARAGAATGKVAGEEEAGAVMFQRHGMNSHSYL